MSTNTSLRNQFSHLRDKPGPKGWKARCAKELKYSRAHVSRVINGHANGEPVSPAALAAINAWKKKNKIPDKIPDKVPA